MWELLEEIHQIKEEETGMRDTENRVEERKADWEILK